MMHHVVLGGAGFIGSHLTKKLMKLGNDPNNVTVIDNLSTGSRDNVQYDVKRFNCDLTIDIVDKEALFGIFPKENKVDVVWNLACPASPIQYQKNPIQTILTTTQGTHNALQLAYMHGAKFFQASTSEVYGNPLVHPQVENYWGNVNSWGPRACYDEGKRLSEALCYEYRTMVDVRIARIFNTYGPNMSPDDGRVVSNFIVQALKGNDITIYGDGQQTRCFCYVDDMVRGFLHLVNSPTVGLGPVNLGNPVEYTVEQLANFVITLTKSSSKIIFKDLPVDDPLKRKPDISKARERLGWAPEIDIDEGLQNTIDYFDGLNRKGKL